MAESEDDAACVKRLASGLDEELRRVGRELVCAFVAEPVRELYGLLASGQYVLNRLGSRFRSFRARVLPSYEGSLR